MKGFYISIKNDLLEPKHVENMGAAIWLYMWLIDKMTSVNENGVGKVLNNLPITYDVVRHDLGISRRTYQRYVDILRDSGYIKTIQAQYGMYIMVTKAKKQFGKKADLRSTKSGTAKQSSYAESGTAVVPNLAQLDDKSGTAVYIYNNTVDNTVDNTITGTEVPDKKNIGIYYYQAIKELKLPVPNHNTIRVKIKAMEREDDLQAMTNYLIFIKDYYPTWKYKYKPKLNTGLDIYTKRVQIRNALYEHIDKQKADRVVEI